MLNVKGPEVTQQPQPGLEFHPRENSTHFRGELTESSSKGGTPAKRLRVPTQHGPPGGACCSRSAVWRQGKEGTGSIRVEHVQGLDCEPDVQSPLLAAPRTWSPEDCFPGLCRAWCLADPKELEKAHS